MVWYSGVSESTWRRSGDLKLGLNLPLAGSLSNLAMFEYD